MIVAVPDERDASSVDLAQWPDRPIGSVTGFRQSRFQTVFRQSVLDEIHLHGQGSNDIEVCGVLIGGVYRDDHGPYLLIEHCIRGNGARTKATNVTFTAETWAHIQNVMDRDFPDSKMVGWYHTHPGFGIFLSDMDVFICENFFNLPWQVAFVYDPVGGDEGNFIWRAGKPERDLVLIQDDVTPQSAQIPLISTQEATADISTSELGRGGLSEGEFDEAVEEKILELLIRVRRLEKRQTKLVAAIIFLAAFLVMWAMEYSPVAVPVPMKTATQLVVPVKTGS